jgi:hypothetical protein
MLDEFERSEIHRRWVPICILWILLLLSLSVLGIVASVVGPRAVSHTPSDAYEPVHLVKYVLCVMSALELSLSYVIRRSIVNRRTRIYRSMGSYLFGMTVAGSLCVTVGIYGLVVFRVEASYLWLYILLGISAVALVLLRPRKKDLADVMLHSK